MSWKPAWRSWNKAVAKAHRLPGSWLKKIQYSQDTDTLYIEFRAAEIAETNDLDENTLRELDS